MYYSDDDKKHFKNIRESAWETFLEDLEKGTIQDCPHGDYKNYDEIAEFEDTYLRLHKWYLIHGNLDYF